MLHIIREEAASSEATDEDGSGEVEEQAGRTGMRTLCSVPSLATLLEVASEAAQPPPPSASPVCSVGAVPRA